MDCKFTWYNLPNQIKNLGILLEFNFSRLPSEINKFLREIELSNNICYSQFFKPNYKTNWFFLIRDLKKVCELVGCESNSRA